MAENILYMKTHKRWSGKANEIRSEYVQYHIVRVQTLLTRVQIWVIVWCWGLALSILVFLSLFINETIGYQCVFLVNVDIPGQALLKIAYIKPFKYKHVLYTFRKDTDVIIAKRSVEMRQIRPSTALINIPTTICRYYDRTWLITK